MDELENKINFFGKHVLGIYQVYSWHMHGKGIPGIYPVYTMKKLSGDSRWPRGTVSSANWGTIISHYFSFAIFYAS